ncbi:unnamed protein product, partial [marine sediment metagenome]
MSEEKTRAELHHEAEQLERHKAGLELGLANAWETISLNGGKLKGINIR